jgi:hypothetical protein
VARIMGDSTNLAHIPLTVQIAAYYDDGSLGVATPAQVEQRFPHAKYGWCVIDVNGSTPAADVRDWETGDKAGSLEQWVIDHNAAAGKKNAVVYCNRSTIPEVRQLTGSQILGTDYWLWVATLDGTVFGPGQYPHVIANQVKGAQLTGGDWDMSVVYDDTFFLPLAKPKPAPKPPKAQVPPGQWNNPKVWTWASASIAGVGLNGLNYTFDFNLTTGEWVKK